MPSVLLVVFIVQLSLSIISTVGAQKVNDLVSTPECLSHRELF
jgi:hypothetical protein